LNKLVFIFILAKFVLNKMYVKRYLIGRTIKMELKMMHKKKNSLLKSQEGFTLLEIIAVLVILGILSVVAVPKYFDLQEAAAKKTVQAALAEAIGRVNGYFAQELLGGRAPSEIHYYTDAGLAPGLGSDDLGDFTYTIEAGTEQPYHLLITVTAKPGTVIADYPDASSDSREIPIPGVVPPDDTTTGETGG
jgi:prepilin-type N-terminal cleavage/methylation domain-containing protein